MDKVLEQINDMIDHVFSMPITDDTEQLLSSLQDLRNIFTQCQCLRVEHKNKTFSIYVNPWCVEHGIEKRKETP